MTNGRRLGVFWGLGGAPRLTVTEGPSCAPHLLTLRVDEALRPPWLAGDLVFPLDHELAAPPDGSHVLADAGGQPAIVEREGEVAFLFNPERAVDGILHEAWLRPRRPLHTRLPRAWYQLVPGSLRLHAFRLLARRAGEERGFPAWPADAAADALRHVHRRAWLRAGGTEARAPAWPHGKRWAFVLSHDVDTAAGVARIPEVAAWEKGRGIRAGWFVVGALDGSAIDALRLDGHEVGLHGDVHDNRLAYVPEDEMERRLDGCAPAVARHGMTGFRAPSLLESETLRRVLSRRFAYASQVPDSEVDSLVAPRRGCATVFPFRRHGLLEVPITMPFEDKLLLRGMDESAMVGLWRRKLQQVRDQGGLVQLAVHNEPHLLDRARGAWQQVVEEARADGTAWHATPGEVARWWQETGER